MKVTFDELLKFPNAAPWEADRVKIGKKSFAIRKARDSWDEACYFRFEKMSNGHQAPTLSVDIRELNSRRGRNQPPYHCESVDIPWEIAVKLAEFILEGPWVHPRAGFKKVSVKAT